MGRDRAVLEAFGEGEPREHEGCGHIHERGCEKVARGTGDVRWFEIEPGYVQHFWSGWAEGDRIEPAAPSRPAFASISGSPATGCRSMAPARCSAAASPRGQGMSASHGGLPPGTRVVSPSRAEASKPHPAAPRARCGRAPARATRAVRCCARTRCSTTGASPATCSGAACSMRAGRCVAGHGLSSGSSASLPRSSSMRLARGDGRRPAEPGTSMRASGCGSRPPAAASYASMLRKGSATAPRSCRQAGAWDSIDYGPQRLRPSRSCSFSRYPRLRVRRVPSFRKTTYSPLNQGCSSRTRSMFTMCERWIR